MGREARGEWDRRRRERMRANGPRESFTVKEIGERDLWRCGICLDPVDPKSRRPDPRAPSVDHIKALWAGGTHTRDNVRITHLFCNMDRNYVDAPTLSPVRVVRNQAGELIVVVGDSSSDTEGPPARSSSIGRCVIHARLRRLGNVSLVESHAMRLGKRCHRLGYEIADIDERPALKDVTLRRAPFWRGWND
jgi:hypothetical protein